MTSSEPTGSGIDAEESVPVSINSRAAAAARTATGTQERNTQRQPPAAIIAPASGGPTELLTPMPVDQRPTANGRRFGGNADIKSAAAAGVHAADPSACTARPRTIIAGFGAVPAIAKPAANRRSPTLIVRPRPNLSASAAAGNTVAALTIVKTLATHDKSAAGVVGNDRRSSGNITVMLDNAIPDSRTVAN